MGRTPEAVTVKIVPTMKTNLLPKTTNQTGATRRGTPAPDTTPDTDYPESLPARHTGFLDLCLYPGMPELVERELAAHPTAV